MGEVGGVGVSVGVGVLTGLYRDSEFPSTVARAKLELFHNAWNLLKLTR